MTVNEFYQHSIKPLTTTDRLQLARMILNDIPAESIVDYDDAWSEADLRDFSHAGWQRAETDLSEADNAHSG